MKYCADNRQCNVLRSYAFYRLTRQINAYHLRHIDVIGLIQKLFYQLRSALAHCHGPQCTVPRMGIRAQNHAAAACKHLPCKLVNHRLMRRHVDAAVLLSTGKSKHMVIFIDGAAHRTKGIVAVRQYIRHRKFGKPRSPCRLDNAYKGNVMTCQLVEPNLQLVHIAGGIVALQNTVGNSLLCRLLFRHLFSCFMRNGKRRFLCVLDNLRTAHKISAAL